MAFPRKLNELCTPALVYFIISFVAMVIISIQNIGNSKSYCVGNMSCNVPSTILVFVVKALYILFWSWLLNLMCKDGHKGIAWFLVLFPFVMFFLILLLTMTSQKKNKKHEKEGMFNIASDSKKRL